MALVAFPGAGPWTPLYLPPVSYNAFPAFQQNSFTSTNASAKMAFIGRVYAKERFAGTKTATNAEFRFGAGLVAGTSATVKVSIQGVSTSAGAPMRPDGTVLGSGGAFSTFNMTDAGVAASTWFSSLASFGTGASLSFGQYIAVVFEWSANGSGATMALSGLAANGNTSDGNMVQTADGTTWALATNAMAMNVVINLSDGTVATLQNSFIASNIGSDLYASGSSPNESGMLFQLPFPCKIDGLWAWAAFTNATSTASLELTDASASLITSVSLDGHNAYATGATNARPIFVPIAEQSIAANTDFGLGLKATSASTNTVALYYFDVNSASHFDLNPGSRNFRYATRAGGAWGTPVTTRRPFMGVRLSAVDDGSGGGTARLFAPAGYIGGLS